MFEHEEEENKKDEKPKTKKIAPKYFIIFDDISREMRNRKEIETLLKQNQHYKSKVIISSQYPFDIMPSARLQINVWCLFRGFNKKQIKKVFPDLDVNMDLDEFFKLYQKITSEPHDFLYIDHNHNEMRKNFDQKISTDNHK